MIPVLLAAVHYYWYFLPISQRIVYMRCLDTHICTAPVDVYSTTKFLDGRGGSVTAAVEQTSLLQHFLRSGFLMLFCGIKTRRTEPSAQNQPVTGPERTLAAPPPRRYPPKFPPGAPFWSEIAGVRLSYILLLCTHVLLLKEQLLTFLKTLRLLLTS